MVCCYPYFVCFHQVVGSIGYSAFVDVWESLTKQKIGPRPQGADTIVEIRQTSTQLGI